MQFIQCHIVGDVLVGKSCLITRYKNNVFEETVHNNEASECDIQEENCRDLNIDNTVKEIKIGDHTVKLSILETECKEGSEHLRLVSYKQADVLVICFSIVK